MIVTSVQIKTAKTQKHLYCPVFTLGAYPIPVLYGERCSFKQEDTPYHYGRECLFTFGEFSDSFLTFPIKSSIERVL